MLAFGLLLCCERFMSCLAALKADSSFDIFLLPSRSTAIGEQLRLLVSRMEWFYLCMRMF